MNETRSRRRAGIRAGVFAALYLFTVLMPCSVAAADPTQPTPFDAAGAVDESNAPLPRTVEPSTLAHPSGDVGYIVTFRRAASAGEQSAALRAVGAVEVSSIPEMRMSIIELDRSSAASDAAALAADRAVKSVEPDRSRDVDAAPGDPRIADQWSLPHIGWDTLHAEGLPTGTATIAILDTGVYAPQPDLQGRLLPGQTFVVGSPADTDPHGHGTWLAGIVAAATDNDTGIAGIGGDGVRVLPITVLGADGTGQDSAAIAGIVAAVEAGADVILMAFSNPSYSPALQAAIDYAWARDVVLVAATGNEGVSTPTYPAGDRGVMAIASTDRADHLAEDSNHGPQTFLAAPGIDILTTAAGADSDPQTDDEYRSVSGTSAAAAEVAGAAAILRALDAGASNAVIVGRLARSAAPAGTRAETGNGRLDLARAARDTGTDSVQPAGAGGGGGPFVGPYQAASATTDCFRTFASGNWDATGTWESAPAAACSVWSAATLTPTSAAAAITIRNGHTATVTTGVAVDQVTIDSGGQVIVNNAVTLTVNNVAGVDLTANGTVTVNGTLSVAANADVAISSSFSVPSGGTVSGFGSAGGFAINSGGNLAIASGATFSGSGQNSVFTVAAGGTATVDAALTNFGQVTVNGTLTASANITVASVSSLQVGGTLTMTGGTLTTPRGNGGSVGSINSGGTLVLSGSSVWSIGSVATATARVDSGGALDIGPSATVSGGGLLIVANGATLRIGSVDGINTTTTSGSVRTTAVDTYGTGANYEYRGTAAQITGAALPATVNNLTINNSGQANVTLTASVTVSNLLTLTSGDLSTGSAALTVTLSAAATCAGTTDVITLAGGTGGVTRTVIGVGTMRCFGNPENQITISSGSVPDAFTVKLVKAVPAAKTDAITRTFSITPTGGSGFAAIVRLHYLDAELNGNTEASLYLWRLNGSWTNQDPTGVNTTRDTTANWVQQTGIATFSDWTLANGAGTPPVLAATVADLAYTENATVALDAGITANDVDSANLASATITMTTNYVNGEDVLAFVNQNGIAGTWTAATGVLALSGIATVANYQIALRSITYSTTSEAPTTATRTVTFLVNDGSANSNTASRQITISAVNDAPVNTVPGAQTTTMNTPTIFSTGNGNSISIADIDAGSADVYVTLTATNGTLTSGSVTGLIFSVGDGSADTTMSFTGTMANINADLDGLTFQPTAAYTGSATVTIVFNDQGNTGSGGAHSDTDAVTVTMTNTAPTAVADGYTTNEDTTLNVPVTGAPYNGVLFNDMDPEGHALTAFLVSNVATGLLTLNGNGSFSYVPVANANGSVTFTYTANDGNLNSNTVTVTITITPVNDTPSFTKGADQLVGHDTGAQTVSEWATAISPGPADEASQAVDFIVSNDFSGLFSAQPAISAIGTLTYTLAAGEAGIATITIWIHDDGGTANSGADTSSAQTFIINVGDGAYISSSGWSTSFASSRYLELTFPAYVPAGSIVTSATFRHEYRSAIAGDTTCYYFEVYEGATLLATHGSAGSPVSCNATTSYASDVVALLEVDTVAEANNVTIRLFVKNSGGRPSAHRIATLGVTSSLD